MLRRRLAFATVLAVAAIALTGCGVVPAGPSVSEEREVGADIHAVRLETGGELVIVRGEAPGLVVTAPETVIEWLGSDTVDGVLVLSRPAGPWLVRGEIRYELTVPLVDRVAVAGSGDVEVDFAGADEVTISVSGSGTVRASGIDAREVAVTIRGSGDIDLGDVEADSVAIDISGAGTVAGSGSAVANAVKIAGSGDVDLRELAVEESRVEISGAGDVAVDPSRRLDVTIGGSGTVRYRGDPQIDSRISGAGNLVRE